MKQSREIVTVRHWQILRLISVNRHMLVRDIAKRFDFTEKTIRRDLEALAAAGFPIIFRRDEEYGPQFVRLERSFSDVFSRLREIQP